MTEVIELRPPGLPGVASSPSSASSASSALVWTSLSSNLKGEHEWALGPLTLVVGRNQRGKTALLEAFRLALVGRHPAVRGSAHYPEGNPKEAVALLAPEEAERLYARLESSKAGAEAVYLAEKSGRTWVRQHRSPVENPGGLGLGEDLSDLFKTGSKVRSALLARFGGGSQVVCPREATDLGRTLWDAAVREVAQEASSDEIRLEVPPDPTGAIAPGRLSDHLVLGVPVADVYVRLATKLDSTKRSLGRRIGALSKRLEEVGSADAVAGTEQLGVLREQLRLAREAEEAGPRRELVEAFDRDWASVEAQLANLPRVPTEEETTRRVSEIDAEMQRLNAELGPLEQSVGVDQGKVAFMKAIEPHLSEHADSCFFCGSKADMKGLVGSLREGLPKVSGRLAANQGRLSAIRQRLSILTGERARVETATRHVREQYENQSRFLNEQKKALEDRKPGIDKLRESLPEPWSGLSTDILERRISELETAERALRDYENLSGEKARWEEQQNAVKVLEGQVRKAAKRLLTEAVAAAEAEVNKWAVEGMEIGYDLDHDAWAATGGTRDDRFHDARTASGFEKSMMVPAIAAAFQPGDPKYILIDDAISGTFDAPHLRDLMRVLSDRVTAGEIAQAILVVPPVLSDTYTGVLGEDTLTGWHVLEM